MSGEHPKLIAARESGDVGPLLGLALDCRAAREAGIYCECDDPITAGDDLMCGRCLHSNRDQERERVRRIVSAHDFTPAARVEFMCDVCTGWEDDVRHNDGWIYGTTSWGERVSGRPASPVSREGEQ